MRSDKERAREAILTFLSSTFQGVTSVPIRINRNEAIEITAVLPIDSRSLASMSRLRDPARKVDGNRSREA